MGNHGWSPARRRAPRGAPLHGEHLPSRLCAPSASIAGSDNAALMERLYADMTARWL